MSGNRTESPNKIICGVGIYSIFLAIYIGSPMGNISGHRELGIISALVNSIGFRPGS
jgi:hypothetical protein